MDIIASGSGAAAQAEEEDVDEQAGDGSNTDVYLNMYGEGIQESGDHTADQKANLYNITTILLFKSYLQ